MSKLESLQNTGWISMDGEQSHYLSGIIMHLAEGVVKEQIIMPAPQMNNNKVQIDEAAAVMESKISQIKDLFPDYGNGFIAACLEVYNHNPEDVIQRILEGTLHEELQCLDTSLETMPLSKSSALGKNDKNDRGKGKLVDSVIVPSTKVMDAVREHQVDGPSMSSSSTVGRFVQKSKDYLPAHVTLNTREGNDAAKAALVAQYEYEDEYDDSFDDLGLSVVESGFEENEILNERINSGFGKSVGSVSENSAQPSASTKWGSRKKPQYYVKDGKNYSYKVAGSVAVANANEASLVTQAQVELIYGLGRGGSHPLGAVKKLVEHQEQNSQYNVSETEERAERECAESQRQGKEGRRTTKRAQCGAR